MVARILKQVANLVSQSESPDERGRDRTDDDRSIGLYTCSECQETYITDDKAACSNCGEPVEPTPSFAELGIGPDGGT